MFQISYVVESFLIEFTEKYPDTSLNRIHFLYERPISDHKPNKRFPYWFIKGGNFIKMTEMKTIK